MDLVIRATVVFFFVFGVTRVVGRRELSSLEPFDLILLVVLGDLIQQGITQSDYSVTGVFLVISTIGLLTVGVYYLNFRSKRLRSILEGEPVLVIQNGQPILASLKRERITTEELEAEARLQQISSLESVQWAVLETSGKISFIPKSDS
jgi:uncharacterized membrane protein YcaP (DUF421 family)